MTALFKVFLLTTCFKVHICRLSAEEHLPGLNCFSDEQLLPILLHMDSDTLLNLGRYFVTW